jgi:hypothetical protein
MKMLLVGYGGVGGVMMRMIVNNLDQFFPVIAGDGGLNNQLILR